MERIPHNKLDLDIEYIIDEYNKGRSANAIGKELGVSKTTVLRRLRSSGVERRKAPTYDEIDEKVLRRLYVDEKKSTRDIADIYGCNNTLISKRLRKYNIPIRKNAGDPAFTVEERREKWGRSGESHHLWRGGITPINGLLRNAISEWTLEQMREHNFKCYVTGEQTHNLEVHHVEPFSEIRDRVIKNAGYGEIKYLSDLSEEQVNHLRDEIVKEHEKIKGFPLDAGIHRLLHSLYGVKVDEDMLEEFKQRYLSREFDDVKALA